MPRAPILRAASPSSPAPVALSAAASLWRSPRRRGRGGHGGRNRDAVEAVAGRARRVGRDPPWRLPDGDVGPNAPACQLRRRHRQHRRRQRLPRRLPVRAPCRGGQAALTGFTRALARQDHGQLRGARVDRHRARPEAGAAAASWRQPHPDGPPRQRRGHRSCGMLLAGPRARSITGQTVHINGVMYLG